MKKTLITAACVVATLSAMAQGTVNFNNSPAAIGGTGAPVFNIDGVTKLGSAFVAQLYAGPVGGSLAPVGVFLPFRDGAGAGFINSTGADTSRTIPGIAAGTPADVQIRAWATSGGATYEAAVASGALYGFSPILSLGATGGAGEPPGLPVNLIGLQSFNLVVPEPSTIALGLLGAAALLLRRRK